MAAVWTDLDRPLMKGALDVGYLDALRQNALWLKERMTVGHNGSKHGSSIDGTTLKRAYPAVLCFATRSGVGPPPSYTYSGTGMASIAGSAAGKVTVNFSVNFAGDVYDYAVLPQVVTSPDTGAALVSWNVAVRHVSTTSVELTFVKHDETGTASLASPEAFVLFAWGKYTDAYAPWATWEYHAPPLDSLVTTEWWASLLTNVALLREEYDKTHSLIDGSHRDAAVPVSAGVFTYKTSNDSSDDRLWVVEPWSSGIGEGTVEKLDSAFDISGTATVARILSHKIGSGYASRIVYGCIAAMNPYQVGATRARLVHPMQYRDAVLFAPRYYNAAGAWSWAEQNTSSTGAPDSIAMLRFGAPFYVAAPDAAARLCGIGPSTAVAGVQSGVLLATLIQGELEELRRLLENGHSSSDGSHDVSPPGIMAVASVEWDGSNHVLSAWSRGVDSVAAIAGSPSGCRVTFSTTFDSFRHWGAVAVGHTVNGSTAANYRAIQCVRNSGAQCDVYQWEGSTPASVDAGFDIVVIGVR